MKARVLLLIAGLLATAGTTAGGCQSGGVGDPCTPEDEYVETFSGFTAKEVNLESRSFQCETRVCLVNHFRGRVSCPLGQSEDTVLAQAQSGQAQTDAPEACRIPGSKDPVKVAVNPQCRTRTADLAVYCSCRCANKDGKTDDGGKYCECPDGYACEAIKDLSVGGAIGVGQAQLAGSYCVKNNTEFLNDCGQGDRVSQALDPCRSEGNCNGITSNP